MMNSNIFNCMTQKICLIAITFFIVGSIFSCKKDGALSPDFDDPNKDIIFTDTFSINTQVVPEDSFRTDLSIHHLLGLYNDPFFGPKSSSIYTQISLTGTNINFGTTPTLDSVVLTLKYQGLYGNPNTPMNINIFELTTPLNKNTNYYSNTYINHDMTPLVSKSFIPNINDSVSIGFDTIIRPPHLRINLGATFGNKLIAGDVNGTNDLIDNPTFHEYLNGLYITTSDSVSNTNLLPGKGSIAYFDLNSSLSTVTLYYNDTSKYDFTINSETAKFARFDHNFTGTDVEKHINNDPTKDSTLLYITTMAGVRTKIDIPNIKNIIQNGNVIINKAELVIPVEIGTEGSFDNAIPTISVVGIDANGNLVFLPDFFEGLDFYGGNLDQTTKTYTFNISRHIHELIYNTPIDYGMYLIGSGSSIIANRSIIGSPKSNTSKMKINITYSKLY